MRGYAFLMLFVMIFGCAQTAEKSYEGPPRDLEVIAPGITSERAINLSLYARGAEDCRFSADDENWGPWEKFSSVRAWEFSGDDGPKQIFYECRDSHGNPSSVVASTVVLDTTPPLLEIETPAEGAKYAGRAELVFTASDNVSSTLRCDASIDGRKLPVGVVTSGKLQNISLFISEGDHSLTLNCRDTLYSTEKNISFTLNKKPSLSLVINNGSTHTMDRTVSLGLESDTAAECRISNSAGDMGPWQPYSQSYQWELSDKDGLKYVYVQCRDSRGVESDKVMDRIVLDSSPPPYITLNINNGDEWTNSRNVTLGLYAYAAKECRFSENGYEWTEWEPYKKKTIFLMSETEGTKYVYYNCRSANGSDIGTVSGSIQYSQYLKEKPSKMSISIKNADSYTASENVLLELNATGAYECRFRQDMSNWTEWEDYEEPVSLQLTGADGAKTIYYECRNDFGSSTVLTRIYLDKTPPEQVLQIDYDASPYSANLFWHGAVDKGSGIKLYNIYRRTNGPKVWVGLTSELNFKDERVVPGETYYYSIQPVDNTGNYGKTSEEVEVVIPGAG